MATRPKSISVLGNCLEVLATLPDNSFDACITDPPYNMSKKKGLSWAFSKHVTMQEAWDQFSQDDFIKFTMQWIKEVSRVVKPNGNIFIFGTYHNIYLTGFVLQQMELKILNSIIWSKPNAQPNITCRMLTESSEQLVWAANEHWKKATKWTFNYKRAKELNGGKQMRNVWEFPLTPRKERVAGHPTQKPLSVLTRLIEIGTNPGDIVLDPFAGTGTTGVAANSLDRSFYMVEREAPFFEAQQDRLGQSKLLEFKTKTPVRVRSRKKPSPPTKTSSALDA